MSWLEYNLTREYCWNWRKYKKGTISPLCLSLYVCQGGQFVETRGRASKLLVEGSWVRGSLPEFEARQAKRCGFRWGSYECSPHIHSCRIDATAREWLRNLNLWEGLGNVMILAVRRELLTPWRHEGNTWMRFGNPQQMYIGCLWRSVEPPMRGTEEVGYLDLSCNKVWIYGGEQRE